MLRHWSQFVPNISADIRGHESLHQHHQQQQKQQLYIIVWTHENTAHTGRNGYSAALVADVAYPGKVARISGKGHRSTTTTTTTTTTTKGLCYVKTIDGRTLPVEGEADGIVVGVSGTVVGDGETAVLVVG